jgi:hypothetical protein
MTNKEPPKNGGTPVINALLNLVEASMHNKDIAIIAISFLEIRGIFYVQVHIKGEDTYGDGYGVQPFL